MKITPIIFLSLILVNQSVSQGIDDLERRLSTGQLTVGDSIETLNLLSRQLVFVNRFKALGYANQALALSTKSNNPIGTAYAYRNLSSVYSYNESYFISMEYLQRALDIFTTNNDSIGMANCYVSMGHTYRRLQNREEEMRYHLMAHRIFSRLNDKERIGVTAHNLGETYYNIGDLINSRRLTLQAIEINDALDNMSVLSSCYKVMGMIELAENNLDSAKSYFKKVIDISTQLGENSQKIATAESMIQLADIYREEGDFSNQHKFLLLASEFSYKNDLPVQLQKAYQELILYSSGNNDQEAVGRYINSFRSISDSLNRRQLNDRYMLTKSIVEVHELSKKKAELEEINLSQSQKIQRRNTYILIIGISLVVLLCVLFMFRQLNRKLKNQNLIIENQRKDLEVLNNTKDKFFSIVAHDLKSPLGALKSFSTLLYDHFDSLNKSEILTMCKQLGDSVDNTTEMADNLITWARVQMDDCHSNPETIEVKSIVANVCEVYKDVAMKKGIDVSCSIEDSLTVIGDRDQLEFIVRNLVNNAVKFTHRGGRVSLTAKSLGSGKAQISVSDSGVGISEEFQKKLFSIDKERGAKGTAGEKGTGLGLLLSYEFVKLNGGQIDMESRPGKGTTFHTIFESGNQKNPATTL